MRLIDKQRFANCKTLDWDADSQNWTNQLRKAGNPSEELSRIGNKWSQLKQKFIDEFGDKCWYTEVPRIGTDFDIDHFWPKGRVKDAEGQILKKNGEQHPGYWWKAYDIDNYRYSCIYSNRSREEGGKIDFFPLTEEKYRAWQEGDDCDYDHRLILDPCSLEDVQSVSFEIQTAEIACAYTEEQNLGAYQRVKFSKTCLNLDEPTIKSARLKTVKMAKNIIFTLKLNHGLSQDDLDNTELAELQEAKEMLINMCARKSAFSAAVVQVVLPHIKRPYLAELLPRLDLDP